jgi:hypothetical protein
MSITQKQRLVSLGLREKDQGGLFFFISFRALMSECNFRPIANDLVKPSNL